MNYSEWIAHLREQINTRMPSDFNQYAPRNDVEKVAGCGLNAMDGIESLHADAESWRRHCELVQKISAEVKAELEPIEQLTEIQWPEISEAIERAKSVDHDITKAEKLKLYPRENLSDGGAGYWVKSEQKPALDAWFSSQDEAVLYSRARFDLTAMAEYIELQQQLIAQFWQLLEESK